MSSLRPSHATGYTLILPPGWLRLDARSGPSTRSERGTRSERAARELDHELDQVLSTGPRDSHGPLVAEARKRAHAVLDQARIAGALDLYLPLGGMHGTPVPASFLVTMATFDGPPPNDLSSQDPEATSAHIAAMMASRIPAGEVRQMPAGIAVRSRQVIAAAGESPWPGTRVDYQWPLPSEPMKWALASFTTTGAGKPDHDITELLVGLFDAIMLTWRWRPGLVI